MFYKNYSDPLLIPCFVGLFMEIYLLPFTWLPGLYYIDLHHVTCQELKQKSKWVISNIKEPTKKELKPLVWTEHIQNKINFDNSSLTYTGTLCSFKDSIKTKSFFISETQRTATQFTVSHRDNDIPQKNQK